MKTLRGQAVVASFLLVGYLSACSSNVPGLATLMPTSTETSIPSNGAATGTDTPQIGDVIRQCVQFVPDLPDDFIREGSVIYTSQGVYHALDQESTSLDIRGDGQLVVTSAVSPNGQWLAYRTQEENNFVLQVISSDQTYKTKWVESWLPALEWVNDEWLNIPTTNMPRGAVHLFNPFTQDEKILEPNYPDLYPDFLPESHWPEAALTMYDPTLKRVAYLRSALKNGVVMWNLESNVQLWHIDFENAFRAALDWSSDGNYLAIAGQKQNDLISFNYEIFQIDRSGVEEQLTTLSSNFTRVFIWRLEWSPNNRYITNGASLTKGIGLAHA